MKFNKLYEKLMNENKTYPTKDEYTAAAKDAAGNFYKNLDILKGITKHDYRKLTDDDTLVKLQGKGKRQPSIDDLADEIIKIGYLDYVIMNNPNQEVFLNKFLQTLKSELRVDVNNNKVKFKIKDGDVDTVRALLSAYYNTQDYMNYFCVYIGGTEFSDATSSDIARKNFMSVYHR